MSRSIDTVKNFVPDNLMQEKDTEYTYFDPNERKCVKWPAGTRVPQGCAPFASEGECSFACREYDENELAELEEELEEEAVELGEFLFHFFIMFYMCLGLALVCEDFFVAALEIIIEKLKLPPDVAGATFMAAGSSSPELFVATVAVFAVGDAGHRCLLTSDDSPDGAEFALPCDTPEDSLGWLADPDTIGASGGPATSLEDACMLADPPVLGQRIYIDEGVGVGAVVGSTMFNTLNIIGGSAIVSGKITKLDWRIIMRDGTTYMFSIFLLAYCLNMPTMEEHPVLAFFEPGSDKCLQIPLTEGVAGDITKDHYPAGVGNEADFTAAGGRPLVGGEEVRAQSCSVCTALVLWCLVLCGGCLGDVLVWMTLCGAVLPRWIRRVSTTRTR